MSEEGCFPVKVRQNTPSEYIIVQMTASYLLMTSGTVQASITSHEYDHLEPSLPKNCAKHIGLSSLLDTRVNNLS